MIHACRQPIAFRRAGLRIRFVRWLARVVEASHRRVCGLFGHEPEAFFIGGTWCRHCRATTSPDGVTRSLRK